jgi:hypothetical protein
MFRYISALAALAALSLTSIACANPTSPEEAAEVEETSSEIVSRSAAFETYQGLDGHHYFTLVAGNGANVLRSQGYDSRAAAEAGVQSAILNGYDVRNFQTHQASGEFYFDVKATNGQVVGTSRLFTSKPSADRSATTVRALIRIMREQMAAQATTSAPTTPAPRNERFELFVGEDGAQYFRLRAGNGEILLSSQAYTSKQAAQNGIASVKTNGVSATSFEIVESESGFFVNLVAANGEVIARGESYSSKSNATRAVNRMAEILRGSVVTPS